ncbi:hypothetical protein PSTT_06057, partial [Puccinia striiformis]
NGFDLCALGLWFKTPDHEEAQCLHGLGKIHKRGVRSMIWAMGFGTIARAAEVEGLPDHGGPQTNLDDPSRLQPQITQALPDHAHTHLDKAAGHLPDVIHEAAKAFMIGKVTGYNKDAQIWHILRPRCSSNSLAGGRQWYHFPRTTHVWVVLPMLQEALPDSAMV